MIVEDQAEARKLLAGYLKRKKFRIIEAENGKDALKKLKEKRPDLIVLDANIPTIMLTIRKEPNDLDHGLSLGADFYLPKPFSLDNLMRFIELIIRDKKVKF